MVIVQDILVSDEVLTEQFLCKLDACKGACCWEGDYGAPLEPEELQVLQRIYEPIKPFLLPESVAVIEKAGLYKYFEDLGLHGTQLLDNGACVFLAFEPNGVAKCGIEKAWEAGATDFKKPISCHLYPIRVVKNEELGFEAINYDRWDICSPACSAGKAAKLPVFRFLREAIVRKYGESFYEEMEAAAAYLTGE